MGGGPSHLATEALSFTSGHMTMSREEERLRRAISRGAGEAEILRLLKILQEQRADRMALSADDEGLGMSARSTHPATTRSKTAVHVPGARVLLRSQGDLAPAQIRASMVVRLCPAGAPAIMSLLALEGRNAEGQPRVLTEYVVKQGEPFKALYDVLLVPPVRFQLAWRTLGDEAKCVDWVVAVSRMSGP